MNTIKNTKSRSVRGIFFTILLFASVACHESEISCLRVKNNLSVEQLEIQNFKNVYYNGPGNFYVDFAETYSLKIHAPREVIDAFDIDVIDDFLNIRLNRCFNGPYDCDVYLTSPQFKSIEADGTARLLSNSGLYFNHLKLRTSGAARMNLEVVSDSIECLLGSAGKSSLTGTANYLQIRHSGAGDLEAFSMAVRHISIEQNSIGQAKIHAIENLAVIQRGSGKIYYKGNPPNKSIESVNPSNVIAFTP